jgi:hypothetical protein
MPHHAVIREDKITIKIRVGFNASFERITVIKWSSVRW